jgi:hypothetical protein
MSPRMFLEELMNEIMIKYNRLNNYIATSVIIYLNI